MAKTYNTLTSDVTAGSVLTATLFNQVQTNIRNYRVPPMAQIALSNSVAVATASHTSFTGFTSSNATEVFDTDGMVTLSGTASAITIDTAGIYLATATATWAANATGVRYSRIVRSRSGTLVAYAVSSLPNLGGTVEQQNTLTALIDCQQGDLIRLMVYQDRGGDLNLLAGAPGSDFGGTRLSAVWVGQSS